MKICCMFHTLVLSYVLFLLHLIAFVSIISLMLFSTHNLLYMDITSGAMDTTYNFRDYASYASPMMYKRHIPALCIL